MRPVLFAAFTSFFGIVYSIFTGILACAVSGQFFISADQIK